MNMKFTSLISSVCVLGLLLGCTQPPVPVAGSNTQIETPPVLEASQANQSEAEAPSTQPPSPKVEPNTPLDQSPLNVSPEPVITLLETPVSAAPEQSAPEPTFQGSAEFPGDPALLSKLVVSPSVFTLAHAGDKAQFFVIAKDSQGRNIDPKSLNVVWEVGKPDLFRIDQNGEVVALNNSGYSPLKVRVTQSQFEAQAQIVMGSSGGGGAAGGGGGGSSSGGTPPQVSFVGGFN